MLTRKSACRRVKLLVSVNGSLQFPLHSSNADELEEAGSGRTHRFYDESRDAHVVRGIGSGSSCK